MNRVSLIGNLTRDPELRYTQNNIPVAHFTIAVNRPVQKDKEQETDFIDVVVWNKQAENVNKYLKKGGKVAVEGSIKTGTYEKDGKKYKSFDINAERVEFLSQNVSVQDNNTQDAKTSETDFKNESSMDDEVFAQFGESIEIDDDGVAF